MLYIIYLRFHCDKLRITKVVVKKISNTKQPGGASLDWRDNEI